MRDAPAILTPERIEAMLSGTAEVCFAGVTEAGERLKAAEDAEAFERTARALQTLSRGLRQTIALKLRFDREQAAASAEARRLAEEDRQTAETTRRTAINRHYAQVRQHFGRLLWTEYEDDDAQEIFDDLDDRLDYLAKDDPDAFLQTPVDALITQISEEFGVGDFKPAPEPDPDPEPPPAAAEPQPSPPAPAKPWRKAPPKPDPACEAEPPPRPPDPPPDPPPPAPYSPPPERQRPHQPNYGGWGW